MADIRILLYSIGGFFFGLFLFFKGFSTMKRKQTIENIPTSKIRSVAMGLVEIYGQVIPAKKKILKSPFSGTKCVYYKYLIEEYRSSGKSSHWATVLKDINGVPFFLRDKTGNVLVDPKGAEIDIPSKYSYTSGFGRPGMPKEIQKFLKTKGIDHKSLFGISKQMRFREWYIPAPKTLKDAKNIKLYVLGTAGDNPYVEEATSHMGYEDVMIGKGKGNKPFFISTKSEKKILGHLGFSLYLNLIGGALLSIGTLFIILMYLNLI